MNFPKGTTVIDMGVIVNTYATLCDGNPECHGAADEGIKCGGFTTFENLLIGNLFHM